MHELKPGYLSAQTRNKIYSSHLYNEARWKGVRKLDNETQSRQSDYNFVAKSGHTDNRAIITQFVSIFSNIFSSLCARNCNNLHFERNQAAVANPPPPPPDRQTDKEHVRVRKHRRTKWIKKIKSKSEKNNRYKKRNERHSDRKRANGERKT